jgi:hypothetical protein
MHRAIHRQLRLLVFILLVGAACDDNTPTTRPTPTPTPVTEMFSGSVNPNGAAVHQFSTMAGGSVTATLTTVTPTVALGLSLGTWNGAVCQIILANDNAVQGTTLTGTASALGSFCVRVYDIGRLTQSTSYQLTVTHP